jgi:ribosomal-protein-alanine N-acetyltransferase
MASGPALALDIRPIGPFDTELLAELHRRCFTATWDRPWSAQSFAEILAMPGAAGLLASLGPEPVGFGLTLQAADEVELLLLAVLPDRRGHGIAGKLLSNLLAMAGAKGARRALLEVADANRAAIACYARIGFAVCGRRKHYYPGSTDALILDKVL